MRATLLHEVAAVHITNLTKALDGMLHCSHPAGKDCRCHKRARKVLAEGVEALKAFREGSDND